MRKLLFFRQWLLALLLLPAGTLTAQNYFNFNCQRDTTIAGCASGTCFTLLSKVPDIRASTASYVVNPASNIQGCLPAAIDPGGTGTPTNLTIDDRYTSALNIGFPFSFFGTTYNQLIASTNGYVSFDISEANAFSHWDIINGATPQNLPSTFYDRALIMGPYHDLNPSYTTSPNKKIQYSVIGTAPHRKWVLSFYKVPLFLSPDCSILIENTHQIILYESTGIIEVFIYSKQICLDWNEGRAMVGLQNYDQNQGIMAPGRAATDNPWGTVGMNETWRFTPASGNSLFKRVELLDLGGNIVTTGTSAPGTNGNLDVSFSNVCAQAGTTSYIVRSVYQKNDDPNVEIYGLDTVRVNLGGGGSPVPSATVTPTNCLNNTGAITLSSTGGSAPYQYSLNGGAYQSSNQFTGLAQGSYTITVRDNNGCTGTVVASVALQNDLSLSVNGDAQVCLGGSFTPTVNSNASGFSWAPVTGVSNPSIANPTITPAQTTTYTVTATRGICTDQRSFVLTVAPGASANAGQDAIILLGDSHQMNATASPGTYAWTPAAGLSATNILNPIASPQATTTYTLNVTTPLGCVASDQVTITVVPYCVKPMNAFTPNGDGINELWLITDDMGCIVKMTAQVFNRYGAKVFESNDYKNNWNGTRGGQPLPDGTYYYVIRYHLINGENVQMKGNVTILR